jgi:RTX calcium-binding nonapeptide repeat (4 copies)
MRKRPLIVILVVPVIILVLPCLAFVESETTYGQVAGATTSVPATNFRNAFNENVNTTSQKPTTATSAKATAQINSTTAKGTASIHTSKNLQTTFAELAKCLAVGTCRPIVGSEGDDRIQGGNGSSLIIGLAGNDIIHGGTGDNVIIGGPGDDQLYGGVGNNIIIAGGQGTNQIYGGKGNNILIAGSGNTLLVAGHGNDKLYGGAGNDVLIGGSGADYFACGTSGTGAASTSKSVVLNFNASKGDDTDGNCAIVLGQ